MDKNNGWISMMDGWKWWMDENDEWMKMMNG